MMRKGGAGGTGAECALDAAECINLQKILQAFNSTISEEHAWALFYQCARSFQKCFSEGATCYSISEPKHVLLHKDGSVHPSTLLHPGDDSSREIVTSEQQSLLKQLIKDKIHIVENKDVSSNNNQMKKAAWIEILQSFNQLNDTKRDLPQLLNQWRNTKNNIKKRDFEYRRNRNATGGGPPPPSPPLEDTEIMEILPNEFEVDNNIYDSDSLNIKVDHVKKINMDVNEPGCSSSSLLSQAETVSIQDNLDMDWNKLYGTSLLPSLQPETVTVQVHSPKPDAVNKKKPKMGNIKKIKNRVKLVVNLALVIYHALDYTHSEDEERLISPDLEGLITEMTACEIPDEEDDGGTLSEGSETSEVGRADTDDEGIERDAEPAPRRRRRRRKFMLRDVVERCVWHCGGGGRCARDAAANHYRAVCRALVAEALELASFLARVRVGGVRDLGAAEESITHLDTLQFSDWARFWMQVIGELRMGVKLKKVNYSRTPIEYELTPYEILMDDIRSRRYTLRKVDGQAIPHSVKKDAHAMILEFIRSRPPLKKASERKLPPLRREVTPREQLMQSIQSGRTLRPTPYSRRLSTSGAGSGPGGGERRGGDVTPHAQPQRRLIKVDFDNLEDDEDEDDTETCTSPEVCAPQPYPRQTVPQQAPKPWKRTEEPAQPPRAPPRTRISHDEYHQFCDEALESYDLATQCPSRRASMRRHTVTHPTCPLPTDGAHSLPHSRPGSRASCAGAASIASSEADAALGELSWSRSSLQDELIKSVSGSPTNGSHKQWQDAIMSDDRLSLTLEEIVHIRSVLTKAELEVLPVEGRVKEDVEKRRVCFLCLKTRFGIFGPWGQKCKLCKKTVCQKCCSKMRIPTEHFAHVPVVLLSPSLLPSPEDEAQSSFPRSLMSRLVSPEHASSVENSVGSAPNSPAAVRRSHAHSAPGSRGGSALGFNEALSVPPPCMSRSVEGPESMPVGMGTPTSTLDRRARYGRTLTGVAGATAAERLRGVQMAVCHDCKAMVLQIIKSSRASRSASRDRALRHLTLDLAPVYTADC